MNREVQNGREMPEDEIYALLDQAMSDERLRVKEELIQRTLDRIKEEDVTVTASHRKPHKRFGYTLRYICAAAAAVLIFVIGGRAIGTGFISDNEVKDAAPEDKVRRMQNNSSSNTASGYYSKSDEDGMNELSDAYLSQTVVFPTAAEGDCSAEAEENIGTCLFNPSRIAVPEELREVLTDAGYAPSGTEAEYWEYVHEDTDRITELIRCLKEKQQIESKRPEKGAYVYSLLTATGITEQVFSEEPLEFILHIETEHGGIWCFFGNTLRMYVE